MSAHISSFVDNYFRPFMDSLNREQSTQRTVSVSMSPTSGLIAFNIGFTIAEVFIRISQECHRASKRVKQRRWETKALILLFVASIPFASSAFGVTAVNVSKVAIGVLFIEGSLIRILSYSS